MNEPAPAARPSRARPPQRRIQRNEVNGWINLDKPVGVTSTQAVGRLKFLFNAKKAGHAGTLDPLASGVLPVAFGEATKTVSVVQDGSKAYRFAVKWGVETDTDDAEGRAVATSDLRPEPAAIEALLPGFIGVILQTPPMFSAIKIAGERAYDLARDGAQFEIAPREITVHRFELVGHTGDESTFEADAARAAMCARSPATSAARSAAMAMSRCCAAPASARSRPSAASASSNWRPVPRRSPPRCSASRRA